MHPPTMLSPHFAIGQNAWQKWGCSHSPLLAELSQRAAKAKEFRISSAFAYAPRRALANISNANTPMVERAKASHLLADELNKTALACAILQRYARGMLGRRQVLKRRLAAATMACEVRNHLNDRVQSKLATKRAESVQVAAFASQHSLMVVRLWVRAFAQLLLCSLS